MKAGILGTATVFPFLLLLETSARAQPGALDLTFNPGSGANNSVYCVALQTNGQVLIGGRFSSIDGQSRNKIARLNAVGGLDAGFLPLEGPDSDVFAIAPMPGGSVLIGGGFGAVNAVLRRSLAKMRDDGSLDVAFPDLACNGPVRAVTRQDDGNYLIVGGFTSIGNLSRKFAALVDETGTVLPGFNPGALVTNGGISAATLQSDGKVIVAGNFTGVGLSNRTFIARVAYNGSLDKTFDAGFMGGQSVDRILLQPDGKLIVAGQFSSINGYSRRNIARLDTNGAVDVSFVLPNGLSGIISSLSLQPDGKCIVVGDFSPNKLVRLNIDGGLDTSFTASANATVFASALQPDGKLVVGGDFQNLSGTKINGIARLDGDNSLAAHVQFLSPSRYFGTLLQGAVSNTYRVEWTTNLNTPSLWTPLLNVTLETSPQLIFDPSPISEQRFYRAVELP